MAMHSAHQCALIPLKDEQHRTQWPFDLLQSLRSGPSLLNKLLLKLCLLAEFFPLRRQDPRGYHLPPAAEWWFLETESRASRLIMLKRCRIPGARGAIRTWDLLSQSCMCFTHTPGENRNQWVVGPANWLGHGDHFTACTYVKISGQIPGIWTSLIKSL